MFISGQVEVLAAGAGGGQGGVRRGMLRGSLSNSVRNSARAYGAMAPKLGLKTYCSLAPAALGLMSCSPADSKPLAPSR
jgi:hypothetical protein